MPAATVASKVVSHLIEMGLLLVAVVALGNWRALMLPALRDRGMIVVTIFALGLSFLFSIGNVFYRDIHHFSGIFFFIWMFLTPIAYPYYILGGGLNGNPAAGAILQTPRYVHLLGHALSLGSLFKLNPMTDAVLTVPSLLVQRAFAWFVPSGQVHGGADYGRPPPPGYVPTRTFQRVVGRLRLPRGVGRRRPGHWAARFPQVRGSPARGTIGLEPARRRRRKRLQEVPALSRAQPLDQGGAHARRAGQGRHVLGARRRELRGLRGLDDRAHRRERVRQVDHAQMPGPDPAPRHGIGLGDREDVGPLRTGRRLPP